MAEKLDLAELLNSGRASLEDMAEALSHVFGGAEGLALISRKLMLDPSVRPATRLKILANTQKQLEAASKQYGDRAKLASMTTQQIEMRLLSLLAKHDFVVPIPGVDLARSDDQEAAEAPQRA